MGDTIYVVGHKNPDSDSICSALSYAYLKRQLGFDAVAGRLGPINDETKYVLRKFDVEGPLIMTDARSQLFDINLDEPILIDENATLNEAWISMLGTSSRSLCVVDKNQKLKGVISTSNMANVRLFTHKKLEEKMRTATLDSICKTIEGDIVNTPVSFNSSGKVFMMTLNDIRRYGNEVKGGICILSAGDFKHKELIEKGASCLVITCGEVITPDILHLARIHDCAIITTSWDSMSTAKIIYESFPIKNIMTDNVVTYNHNEYCDDVLAKMMNTRYRSYPVLDDEGNIVGAVSRYHLLKYKRKRFILVDHSAKNQAINHIDEAYIEEIIDHHHIGNIETDHPIYYRNQRCGCTATIVTQLYLENEITPPREIAGLLLSAIISDTLNFKSKTTTEIDIKIAKKLAKWAEVDLEEYAIEMLSASVALRDTPVSKILNRDLKNYEIGKYSIAVGQTNYHNVEDIQSILKEFRKNLEKEQEEKKKDLVVMMFTHVLAEGTMFVFSGPLSYIMKDVMASSFDEKSGYDHKILSRKQQLIPKLSGILKNI